jgi:hypothetical protein
MAIALAGQAGLAGVSHASPETITYASTAGNTLIVAGVFFNASATNYPTSITDTAGNTWQVSTTSAQTPPTAQNNVSGTGLLTAFIAWCVGAAAVTSVTIARQDSGSVFWRVALSEWSGIVQFDNSWSGIATTPVSPWTMGPVQLNTSGELVIGAIDINAGTPGVPTGWTAFTSSGSAFCAYDLPGTTGSFSPQWRTSANTAEQWAGALAVFSPVAVPAFPATLAVTTAIPPPAVITGPAPATLAVTTAIPAPAVTTTGGAIVTMGSALAAAVSLPVPAIVVSDLQDEAGAEILDEAGAGISDENDAGSAVVAVSPLAVTAAQPAVTVTTSTDAHASPATLAVTSSAPAPVIRQDRTLAPATVAAATSVPAPAVTAGGSAAASPAVLAAATAEPAPAVRQDRTAAPAALAAATAQPAVTVTTSGNATVTPAALAAATAVPAPAVTAGGSSAATPATLAVTTAIPAPVVRQDRTLIPVFLAVSVSAPAPSASSNANPAVAVLTILAAFPATAASSGATLTPAVLTASVTVPLPVPPFTIGTLTASDTRTGGPGG